MRYTEVVGATRRIFGEYSYRLTVRQVYYRLISPPYQLFPNTATNYKTFDKILTKARERHEVDWRKIEDRARSILGGERNVFDSPDGYVDWLFGELNEQYYDKSYWEGQPNHVEVWVEKDALSTLFERAVKKYRIVVFPSRGYSSYTKVMEALERFPREKNVIILHFGDHDPSGLDMSRDLSSRLDGYSANDGGLVVKRIALSIEQVRELALPPNPTKKADSRAREYTAKYGDECWELDAVPPDTLARWVRGAVEEEIDGDVWKEMEERVKKEREKIRQALEQSSDEIDSAKEEVTQALRLGDSS
ncbi:MAG: hypothetical protein JRN09_09025 [Nitrososphaerota archaeon]|nr:hypothetical protein [Nitrososphaerota archaeon]